MSIVNTKNVDHLISFIKGEDALAKQLQIGFSMLTWISPGYDHNTDETVYEGCGTTCCMAGAISVMEHGSAKAALREGYWGGFQADGAKFLGISDDDAYTLFVDRADHGVTVDQAVQVLEHLKTTGEVDWSVAGL